MNNFLDEKMDTSDSSEINSRIEKYMDDILNAGESSIAFHGVIRHTAEDQQRVYQEYQNNLTEIFKDLKDDLPAALSHYVKTISDVTSYEKTRVFFSLLDVGVTNNLFSPRLVCDTLLKHETFTHENANFWKFGFMLIGRLLPSIDYKGVRNIFKAILDKAHNIALDYNVALLAQMCSIKKVLETILDRNNCLLPSYLILDEIQKKQKDPTYTYPHWSFSGLIEDFIDSFRPVAQMVSLSLFLGMKSDENTYGHCKLLPIVGYSSITGNTMKLDPVTAKFQLKGMLPYSAEWFVPQNPLIRYILYQLYSRDLVVNMFGFNKEHMIKCSVLEKEMVELIALAMEKIESENDLSLIMEDGPLHLMMQHFSCQLIYFFLIHAASFSSITILLRKRLTGHSYQKSRDHLMWALLQFISSSIKNTDLNEFIPVMKLYDLLYPEKEALPLPDVTKANCTHSLAMASIFIHLIKKAQQENTVFPRKIPIALSAHLEYLQNTLSSKDLPHSVNIDYRLPLLCNAYSTNQECFTHPMRLLVEAVDGTNKDKTPPTGSGVVTGPIKPLSMSLLDSLTIHTKMSLVSFFVTQATKLAQSKSSHCLSPALVETCCRVLVYNEIESMGFKKLIADVLPQVFVNHSWNILHTLFEMFSYRLHHFNASFRMQLLLHLQSLATMSQTNLTQLLLCIESTALKLITGFTTSDVQPQLAHILSESKSVISNDSEELNKVLVLTLARAIHIAGSESHSGSWCKKILSSIMQVTPHSWSSFTLECFPKVLAEFYEHHVTPKENKSQLKRSVEEEYRKWKTMSNENDIIAHFSQSGSLFLCLLWKMLLENDRISTIAYGILDRIGARALSSHLRTFADFLVYEFAISPAGLHVSKYIDGLNDLIWKYHVIQLDRLILCLALRSFESKEAQVCFLIIQMLLMKPSEFKNRVYDFVKDNSPEHWKQTDWHDKHMIFHRMYEEKFYFEGLHTHHQSGQHTYLPVYFGNVCLRFLPVLDLVIHRFLELPSISMSVEGLLDTLGCLYKFHDRPLTYLYNTLHYYEQKLKDRPPLKKKLVSSIVGSLKDIHPDGWALSEAYLAYIEDTSEELTFIPDQEYYVKLVGRLVDTIAGNGPFPTMDYRFNEFMNEGAHALHVTCIELMALPCSTVSVGNSLLDVVAKRSPQVVSNIAAWMNAVGLILTALPDAYWSVLNYRILEVMQSRIFTDPARNYDIFKVCNFEDSFNEWTEVHCSYIIPLTHAVWYHASIGKMCTLTEVIREKFKPAVKTESQFLFVCHLVAPFLQRFQTERARYVMEITLELYEMLEIVDKNCEEFQYIDSICDLLYHIKYMFVGDAIKNEIEKSVKNLRPAIQRKLRFITHCGRSSNHVEEVPII